MYKQLLLFVLLTAISNANAEDEPYTFVAHASNVTVQLSATNPGSDTPVAGLELSQIKISDNGKPAKPVSLRPIKEPYNILILMDLTDSSSQHADAVIKAAEKFEKSLRPMPDKSGFNRVGIMYYGHSGQVYASALTSDPSELSIAMSGISHNPLTSAAGAALNFKNANRADSSAPLKVDSLVNALDSSYRNYFANRGSEPGAIILISNGDAKGAPDLDDLQELAGKLPVVYSVRLATGSGGNSEGDPALRQIAESTGGSFFAMGSDNDALQTAIEKVDNELSRSYKLYFVPSHPIDNDESYSFQVSALGADGKPLNVKTRTSYFSAMAPAPLSDATNNGDCSSAIPAKLMTSGTRFRVKKKLTIPRPYLGTSLTQLDNQISVDPVPGSPPYCQIFKPWESDSFNVDLKPGELFTINATPYVSPELLDIQLTKGEGKHGALFRLHCVLGDESHELGMKDVLGVLGEYFDITLPPDAATKAAVKLSAKVIDCLKSKPQASSSTQSTSDVSKELVPADPQGTAPKEVPARSGI